MSKLFKLFGLILAFAVVLTLFASCGGEKTAPAKDAGTEKSTDFESIDRTETDTSKPETETAPETESEPEETEPETEPETSPEGSASVGLEALRLAEKLIGTKFKFGGIGPDEFDNSGFIYYIFKESGCVVPRLARDMQGFGRTVSRNEIAPGDILVFANEIGGGPEFVGIYAGDGQFIACNNPDSPTKLQPIGNYWGARFISARRVG